MGNKITFRKIKRMENQYGPFKNYLEGGWLLFKKALVSSDQKIVLKHKTPKTQSLHT